jgi:hypothetical protein
VGAAFLCERVVNVARTGRPKKEIDKKQFENLCALFCTEEDIASFFECSVDTVNNWCKRTYKDENGKEMTFSDVYKKKNSKGKVSLRRYQFELAKKNATMAIWLGKQYLEQRDNIDVQTESPNITINVEAATADDIVDE